MHLWTSNVSEVKFEQGAKTVSGFFFQLQECTECNKHKRQKGLHDPQKRWLK